MSHWMLPRVPLGGDKAVLSEPTKNMYFTSVGLWGDFLHGYHDFEDPQNLTLRAY